MSKFKIGDKVIVTEKIGLDDTQLYEVGSIGIVVESRDGYKWGNVDFNGNIEDVYWKEVKHYEETEMALPNTMTAEQIRNEILRIRVRIEEAKKDIENAEKERNSLVEKLREKGFELAHHTTNSRSQKLTVGDFVRITSYNKEYHDCNCVDQTAEVFKVDNSARPYYVRTESNDYFWCTPEEVEKI